MNYRKSFIQRGVYPVESSNAHFQFVLSAAAAAAGCMPIFLTRYFDIIIKLESFEF
jgi:hypothetical protein